MTIRIGAVLAVLLLFSCAASAELLQSQAGLDTCVQQAIAGYSNGCTATTGQLTKVITPDAAWEPAGPNPPQWISYALTGISPDTEFQPTGGQAVVFQVFQPIALGNTSLHLQVWADDTAGVYLDGVQLMAPVFSQSICSGQPIGCRPQDVGQFDMSIDGATAHTLRFDVFQVGTGTTNDSNPMGLLYDGIATPEPTSIVLFGTFVLGVAGLLRRRRLS